MTEKPQQILVFTTCPDAATARRIADALVEQGLAACVNILPGLQSVYRWQGKIEHDDELLLIIKTQRDCYPALEAAILALHPYELPEIVTVPLDGGLPAYLDWINSSTSKCDD